MKKLVLIGLTIFLIGISISTAALASVEWDMANMYTAIPYEEKNYVFDNKDKDIFIDENTGGISVRTSPDNQIHLTYYENPSENYTVSEDLRISMRKKITERPKWRMWSYVDKTPYTTLLLPKNYLGKLTITSTNAHISLEDVLLSSIDFTNSNALIELSNVVCTDDINIESVNGKVELDNISTVKDISVESDNGIINLADITAENINVSTNNGKILLEDSLSNVATNLKAVNGLIVVKGIDTVNKISIKTTNGKITGTILGLESDYSIKSSTNFGKNSLSNSSSTGQKILDVKTVAGEIDIEFEN